MANLQPAFLWDWKNVFEGCAEQADVIKPDSLKLAKVKAPRVKPSGSKESGRDLRSSTDSAVSTENAVQHR